MNDFNHFLGIDVSKDSFDVYDPRSGYAKYGNDQSGFDKLIATLNSDCCCVMESTGSYFQQLATFLFENGYAVSVVNPMVIKRFIQMKLCRVKTDKSDARMIAQYALEQPVKLWEPDPEYIMVCKDTNAVIISFKKQAVAIKNKLHSLESRGIKGKLITSLKRQIKSLKREIEALEKDLEERVKEKMPDKLANLTSIPGIGKKTAILLLVTTNGFKNFENHKQLIAFYGLAPMERSSGSSIRGKTRISKAGGAMIRNYLFMCSFNACAKNQQCRTLYERIVNKGKSKKLALIAVCNKLLKQSFSIAKSGVPYDPFYRSIKPTN